MNVNILDSPDFDPIAFINQKFPTEASLDGLDAFSTTISGQIHNLDDELSRAIQTQSIAGTQATQDITDAQEAIVELFDKIADIKQQASQSEKMVHEICADIKRLDCAKTHLQSSITSLKRLQMLLAAVDQLEGLVNDLQYRDTANLLDAVKQLMTHFEKYTAVPVINDLSTRIAAIQAQLSKHIHVTFQDIGQLVDGVADAESFVEDLPGNMKNLSDCCLVVDALGLCARRDLLDEFIRLQLNPYDRLFGPNRPHNGLDHIDRRWAWFKRLFKHIDAKFSNIFPVYWNVTYRITLDFINRTRTHILHALDADSSKENSDVQCLIQSLQSTMKFEVDLKNKFEDISEQQNAKFPSLASVLSGRTVLQTPSKTVKQSPTRRRTSIVDTTHNTNITNLPDSNKICDVPIVLDAFNNCLSKEYDRFLGPYVLAERQNLEDMLRRLAAEEDTAEKESSDSGSSAPVYGSAMSMFAFIKGSIKRCTALTNGQTFLSLTKEFKTCLQQYCESLMSKCVPGTTSNGNTVFKLTPGMEVTLCYLLNTGEYCADVVPQLEQLIKSKMLPEYEDRVDFTQEGDMFLDMVAHMLKALVSGIMDKAESCFKEMQSKNWSSMTEAGEDSPYIQHISKIFIDLMPKIRANLSNSYFKNICSKVAAETTQRFQDVITRQKRISDVATQQLLLDIHILKTILLKLPFYGLDADQMPETSVLSQGMYAKLIIAKTTQIEGILKLVATPEDMLAERFHILWPSGLAADLQMIMNLKGIVRRQDQQHILDSLGTAGNTEKGNPDKISVVTSKDHKDSTSVLNSISVASSTSASLVSNSMGKLLSQDFGIASSARSAVTNLKWSSNNSSV